MVQDLIETIKDKFATASTSPTNGKQLFKALPKVQQKLIVAMASAAKSDGVLDDKELDTIGEMLLRLTGEKFNRAMITDVVLSSETIVSPRQFQRIGKGLIERQKIAILKAAHAVVGSDGASRDREGRYLLSLATGLNLGRHDIEAVLMR